MILLGLTGKAGAGKDTAADYLESRYGFKKYALASPIKAQLNARFGWDDSAWLDRAWKEENRFACGGREASAGFEAFSPRSWAQWLGTEVGRTISDALSLPHSVWVALMRAEWGQLVEERGAQARLVVPDVRFSDEADAIHSLGGQMLAIHRLVPDVIEHVSERGLPRDRIDLTVFNHFTRERFEQNLDRAITEIEA